MFAYKYINSVRLLSHNKEQGKAPFPLMHWQCLLFIKHLFLGYEELGNRDCGCCQHNKMSLTFIQTQLQSLTHMSRGNVN